VTPPLSDATGVIDRQPVTDWLIAVLLATGLLVGDDDIPAGYDPTKPYLVVLSIDGGELWGPPLTSAASAMGLIYQVDAVGSRKDQAMRARDLAQRAILGRAPAGGWRVDPAPPTGLHVVHRDLAGGTGGQAIPGDGQPGQQVWSVPDRYRIDVETTGG
jgi:hypothetical protein